MNFTVDLTNYTAGAATITLIDWDTDANDALTSQALLDAANQSFIPGAYTGSALTWDEDTTSIQLNITAIPEPSSAAALFGLVGAFAMIQRRKRS